ncbi:MAG: sigma-54-dependent transcriptional regulator [Bacteroidota bacterium]
MARLKIFVVEDDQWYGELLNHHLSLNPEYDVHLFQTGKAFLQNLHQEPDLICLDFQLPDYTGTQLLKRIRAYSSTVPVIVISGQTEIGIALQLLRNGADDYIIKNDNTKTLLWDAVLKIKDHQKSQKDVARRSLQAQKIAFDKWIIGESPVMHELYALIERATRSNINVSISGETGTGKEVVAKLIHQHSERKGGPFVAVNVSTIPRELVESELFGHEKGAFTGAIATRIGKFEEANGGTLFLDEIAELDFALQSKLLRVLQEREITRVGGNVRQPLNVRIITATHRDLNQLVREGTFREDLLYRILGFPIQLPALRQRGEDIQLLARHFVREFCAANKLPLPALTTEATDILMRYNFPGNVRELKAVVELACVLCSGKEIKAEHISFPPTGPSHVFTAVEKTMDEYNWDIIQYYLSKYNQNVVTVARKLGIGKSTIYKLLRQNAMNLSNQ